MGNRFFKLLLVGTSLSPILGAVAVNKAATDGRAVQWAPWVIVACLLVLICWGLLTYIGSAAETHKYAIKSFVRDDKETLAFLLAYLLPFLSTRHLDFKGEWLTGVYVLAVIALVVAQSGAFHFNPVLSLLGYHFYSVENESGSKDLLISRNRLRRKGQTIDAVKIADDVLLQI